MIPLYVCIFIALTFFATLVDERKSMPRYRFLQYVGIMLVSVFPLYLLIRTYGNDEYTPFLTIMIVLFGGASFMIMQGYIQGWVVFSLAASFLAGLQANMDASDVWQLVTFVITLFLCWEGYGNFRKWKQQRRHRAEWAQ